jgi:alpha-ketoglutarate-dependent taurine dioxygenase
LGDERFVLSFTLQRGEMLWVNNRTIAHNRTAFADDPQAPRTLVRMWTLDPGRPPLTQQGHLI